MGNDYYLNDPFKINQKIREKYGKDRYSIQRAAYLSRYLWRKLSLFITYLIVNTNISANQLTILGFINGIIAGICFIKGELFYSVIGSLFLIFYCILDTSDGEVARLKNQVSTKGFLFDHCAGTIIDFFLIFGLSVGYYNSIDNSIFGLIWGFIIFGLWTITSDMLRNLKLALARDDKLGSNVEKLGDKLSKQYKDADKLKNIYSLIFSGTTRTILIIIFMFFNEIFILFIILSLLAILNFVISLYIIGKTIN